MVFLSRVICLTTMMMAIPLTAAMGDEAKTCKCPVTGETVEIDKAEASSPYRDATIYLCCDECKGKFDTDHKKFATKANMQLVSTGQAMQVKCPISGHDLDDDQSIVVEEMEICFCCEDCKGQADAAEGDEQLAMLFGDKGFAQAFVVVADEE